MAMFAQAAPPSVLPDISPSRGEIRWGARIGSNLQQRASSVLTRLLAAKGASHEYRISLLEGEMSRSDRGGYAFYPPAQELPGKNITWL